MSCTRWGPGMHPLTDVIGVDIDSHDGYVYYKTLMNAGKFGAVKTDYTNHGFHLTIRLEEPVHLDEALEIRRLLGDDPVRLEYDEAKLRHRNYTGFDTLFTFKNGRRVRRIEC